MSRTELAGKVHLIFKTHLDVGFTDLAKNVVDRYLNVFLPAAMETAERVRQSEGEDRFIWTTGSWLIFEYLERSDAAGRARMERAIEAGDIVWHGLPFTMHCELMEPSLFRFGLTYSQILDERFGRTTIAAKMTDVPGHTRSIVPMLAEAGIEFLHIGVNEGATVPDVPPVFLWRDRSGAELVVMYQHSYGASTGVPGLSDSIAFAHTDDNRGPQDAAQVREVYVGLRAQYPKAKVAASTLNEFAIALREARSSLPVITGEIGDTWIHGTGSDPRKVARYRELSRIRAGWLATDPAALENPAVVELSRRLIMVPEHTWGLDEKTHLADHEHYTQSSFQGVRMEPAFVKMSESWEEQRAYVDQAVSALGTSPLRAEAEARLRDIEPARVDLREFDRVDLQNLTIESNHLYVKFDPSSGAIIVLTDAEGSMKIADPDHPIGRFSWQHFSHEDFERYLQQYVTPDLEWAALDVGRRGLKRSGAESVQVPVKLVDAWHRADGSGHRLVLEMTAEPRDGDLYGGPPLVTIGVTVPADVPEIRYDVQWFDKPESRLPQAGWFSFIPVCEPGSRWQLRKLGTMVTADNVVSNGSRTMHAVQDDVECVTGIRTLRFTTLDAPLVAVGGFSLLNFANSLPRADGGIHFNLYNNVWSTNFPTWYGGDARFRFALRLLGD